MWYTPRAECQWTPCRTLDAGQRLSRTLGPERSPRTAAPLRTKRCCPAASHRLHSWRKFEKMLGTTSGNEGLVRHDLDLYVMNNPIMASVLIVCCMNVLSAGGGDSRVTTIGEGNWNVGGHIRELAVSQCGRIVLVAAGNAMERRRVQVFDATTGARTGELAHDALITRIVPLSELRVVTSSSDGTIREWDLSSLTETRQRRATLEGPVVQLAVDQSGDRWVAIVETQRGRTLMLGGGPEPPRPLLKPPSRLNGVAMHPNGDLWAAVATPGMLYYGITSEKIVESIDLGERFRELKCRNITFSPDGRYLVLLDIGPQQTSVLIPIGVQLRPVLEQQRVTYIHGTRSIGFSPESGHYATFYRGDFACRAMDGSVLSDARCPGEGIGCLVFSPDGDIVFAGGEDGYVWRWSRSSREWTSSPVRLGPVRAVAFSPADTELVACGGGLEDSEDVTHVAIANCRTGEILERLAAGVGHVTEMEFSGTGDTLLVAVNGPGDASREMREQTFETCRVVSANWTDIRGISLSPDASKAVTLDAEAAITWDLRTLNEIGRLPLAGLGQGTEIVWEIVWADETHVCVFTMPGLLEQLHHGGSDPLCIVCTAPGLEVVRQFKLGTLHPRTVAQRPVGNQILFSGRSDNRLRLIDCESGVVQTGCEISRDGARCLAVSPDGAWVVGADSRGVLHTVDLKSGATGPSLALEQRPWCVAWSSSGRIAAGGPKGLVVWQPDIPR